MTNNPKEVCYICEVLHDPVSGRGAELCSRFWRPEFGPEWVSRPWGQYLVLLDEAFVKVKRLVVNPNQKLSYQSHQYRAETWTVSYGKATVRISDIEYEVPYGSNVYIDRGTKHRLMNNTEDLVEVIEVQTGQSFNEEDITRFEDVYGRVFA